MEFFFGGGCLLCNKGSRHLQRQFDELIVTTHKWQGWVPGLIPDCSGNASGFSLCIMMLAVDLVIKGFYQFEIQALNDCGWVEESKTTNTVEGD